jgi:hypothetical protein
MLTRFASAKQSKLTYTIPLGGRPRLFDIALRRQLHSYDLDWLYAVP